MSIRFVVGGAQRVARNRAPGFLGGFPAMTRPRYDASARGGAWGGGAAMAIRISGISVAAVGGALMVLAAAGTIVYGLLGARPVVIERGQLGTGQPWQLVASEQADGL